MRGSIGPLFLLQGNRRAIQRIQNRSVWRHHKTIAGNGGTAHLETFFYELSRLIGEENKLLASPPTPLEKKAGVQAFEKFKYINTVNALAAGDITKWDEILNTPYERILTKLLLNKTEAEYQRKYSELLQAQH